jgi:hypothetical protein
VGCGGFVAGESVHRDDMHRLSEVCGLRALSSWPSAATNAAVAPIGFVFTVCQETRSSTAIAETVVLSIINRSNPYRAHRRVVADRSAARLPRS